MKFNKSYRLLRFLNARHGLLLRLFFAMFAWVAVLVITRSPLLAKGQWREYFRDDFRLACRRTGWYFRQLWSRLGIFDDPFFDFTMETTSEERSELLRFVRNRNRYDVEQMLGDELYLRAADLHHDIEKASSYSPDKDVREFYDICDQVLASLPVRQIEAAVKAERQPDFSIVDAREALQDFANLLPLSRWPWYLISGTFLGLHRDSGFLKHDYDIDIGINAEDISIDELLTVLESHPRYVVKKLDRHVELKKNHRNELELFRLPSLVKLVHSSGLNLDVFIHYTESGICWHGSIIHRWENTPFDLKRAWLDGIEVNVPSNPEVYLTENYGDWRTPVKQFDCTTGTPNLVVTRNFLSLALFLKRLSVFRRTDTKQSEKLLKALISSEVIFDKNGNLNVVRNFQIDSAVKEAV